jgi:hypothetical protein
VGCPAIEFRERGGDAGLDARFRVDARVDERPEDGRGGEDDGVGVESTMRRRGGVSEDGGRFALIRGGSFRAAHALLQLRDERAEGHPEGLRQLGVVVQHSGAALLREQVTHGALGHPDPARKLPLRPVLGAEKLAELVPEGLREGGGRCAR